ncbi:MAG: hypothetical protein WCL70_11395 [Paludibacter sp.]
MSNEKESPEDLFFERKEMLVFKEFDTGFASYQKLEGKVASLRQWTITINVGFVLYLLSNNHNFKTMVAIIFIFMLIILILELRERSSMRFDKENILKLEKLFNEQNYSIYKTEIEKYTFRDLRLSNFSAKTKLRHYSKSMYKGEVIVWYGMWLLVWTGLVLIKRWSWFNQEFILTRIWLLITILSVLFIFAMMLFYKYFKPSKHDSLEE